jgi:hypothetical protein
MMTVEHEMVVPFTRGKKINIWRLQLFRSLLVVIRRRPEVSPLAN